MQTLVLYLVASLLSVSESSLFNKVLALRGGLVPTAEEADKSGSNYYDKYELDYGCDDTRRYAGAMRGFLPTGSLSALPEGDPFLKWWNEYLEKGPDEELEGRLKPFFAADFGEKMELRKGEHPKVIIVQRKLAASEKGVLLPAPMGVDVEVREIWQPWLKSRCNFAVRYIIPSRINIIRILEAKGRFNSVLEIERSVGKSADTTQDTAWARMVFKPSLRERIMGKRSIEVKRKLVSKYLFPSESSTKGFKKSKAL
jgi:hypothetical protein